MATYAIGDVHGCFPELLKLLDLIKFDSNKDTLWFTGDLINRGKRSLEILRFVKSLGDKAIMVLGNHEIYTLFLQYHQHLLKKFPHIEEIFAAQDSNELLNWLKFRPVLHYDAVSNFVLVHAGLPPEWDLNLALALAHELEEALRSDNNAEFLLHIEGNKPNKWDEKLTGIDRLRYIVNALTRMRFSTLDGRLNLTCSAKIGLQPKNCVPWFQVPNRKNKNLKIIFGHWAALEGLVGEAGVYAIDTGCVWGGSLTALRLEDEKRFAVKSFER